MGVVLPRSQKSMRYKKKMSNAGNSNPQQQRLAQGSNNERPRPSREGSNKSRTSDGASGSSSSPGLPRGNSCIGRVGQGHIVGTPSGPPSSSGIVDARIDVHGNDGRKYQATSLFQQYEDLRALQIGQQVCFKPLVDRSGYWAYDVTKLKEDPGQRNAFSQASSRR